MRVRPCWLALWPAALLLLLLCCLCAPLSCSGVGGPSPADLARLEGERVAAENLRAEAERRFPDEWQDLPLNPTYRFEPEKPTLATGKTLWVSDSGWEARKIQRRAWAHLIKKGDPAPENKLMLNMLTRDEEENLERTLPLWAKVVDYWIIGVDDANTDRSVDVIKKHLGHLPGEIVEVHFDGMGPTWGVLAQMGVQLYKGATHQIGVDADYAPALAEFDRSKLNLKCSTHHFQIDYPKVSSQRTSNWLFRSIPGATFIHRVHHMVRVPGLPGTHGEDCNIHFPVIEGGGGFGDKTGYAAKQLRYIKALTQDLIDYPDDSLAYYYLAHANLDYYDTIVDQSTPEAQGYLAEAQRNFIARYTVMNGHMEERFWSMVKLGEIHHRITQNRTAALDAYEKARKLDPSRAEGWLGIGEILFKTGNETEGQVYLRKAAVLKRPRNKDYFMWNALYSCVARFSYAQFMLDWEAASIDILKDALDLLRHAECLGDDQSTRTPEQKTKLIADMRQRIRNEESAWDSGEPAADQGEDQPPSRRRRTRRRRDDEDEEEEADERPRRRRRRDADDAPSKSSKKKKKPGEKPLGHYTPSECLQTLRAWKEVASRARFVPRIVRPKKLVPSVSRQRQLKPLTLLSDALAHARQRSETMAAMAVGLQSFIAEHQQTPTPPQPQPQQPQRPPVPPSQPAKVPQVGSLACRVVRAQTAGYPDLLQPAHLEAHLEAGQQRDQFVQAVQAAYALCRSTYFKDTP